MKTKLFTTICLAICLTGAFEMLAQSENFKNGKQAYLNGQSADALKYLQIAVTEDKFLMKGKDLPLAYAYMSIVKGRFLAATLNSDNISLIKSNPGTLNSSISDLKLALEFNGDKTIGTIHEAENLIHTNALRLGEIISKRLLNMDLDNPSDEAKELAGIMNFELKSYTEIDTNNWLIYDMLGLGHMVLGEQQLAMLDFKRAREVHEAINPETTTEIHLRNFIYSTKYYFSEAKDPMETEVVTQQGIDYIHKMAHQPGNDTMENIKRLSIIENSFSNMRKSLGNEVISISSNKE